MAEIKLDLSEAQIQNAIAVAVAESFTEERRDALLRDIVRAHLAQKPDSYSKETILSKVVGDTVRRIAEDELRRSVTGMEPRVREVVREALGAGFEDSVLSGLRAALQKIVIGNLKMNVWFSENND